MNNQTTNPVFHGSDIEKISACYHIKKEAIVNFAGNVNPLGLPASVKEAVATHADLFSSYPDREYLSLRNVLSNYCDVPADYILPGNGSSELIALLIEARAPKHTLILGPTYSDIPENSPFPEVLRIITICRRLLTSDQIWMIFSILSRMDMIFSLSAIQITRLLPLFFGMN